MKIELFSCICLLLIGKNLCRNFLHIVSTNTKHINKQQSSDNWVVVEGLQIAMLFCRIITHPIVLVKYVAVGPFGGDKLGFAAFAQKIGDIQ